MKTYSVIDRNGKIMTLIKCNCLNGYLDYLNNNKFVMLDDNIISTDEIRAILLEGESDQGETK